MPRTANPFSRTLFLASVLLISLGCYDSAGPFDPTPTTDSIASTLVGSLDPADWTLDPFVLDSTAVVGDTLRLSVTFGGGCRDHEFTFVMSTLFQESNPVQSPSLLSHDSHDDPCDALVHRDLATDLAPLKLAWREAYQRTSGTIVLRILLPDEDVVPIAYDF